MLLAGASLSACVTPVPTHVPLTTAARDAIPSTEVVTSIKQHEIYIFVPAANAAGQGGVIGVFVTAGIDGANTNAAEESVKWVRNAIIDYDFDGVLQADLKASLSEVGFLKVQSVSATKDIMYAGLDRKVTGSAQGAVLMATADYQFNGDASMVTVTLQADLFANSPQLAAHKPAKTANASIVTAPGNAVYRNTFTHVAGVPGTKGNREANLRQWAANNGAALRAALDEGSAKVAEKLAADIQVAAPPAVAAK